MERYQNHRSAWKRFLFLLVFMGTAGLSEAAEAPGVHRLTVVVQETAGIRRFGYPVHAVLPLAVPLNNAERMRLLENGKPIVAQFRPCEKSRQGIRTVSLDFAVSLAPNETREYVAEYGPGSESGPPPKGGMHIGKSGDEFRVSHSTELEFVVPRDLLGLLRQVRTPKTDYLRPGSAGLMIRYKDNIDFRVGGHGPYGVPTAARIEKAGPLASALRFESTEALRGGRSVPSVVLMDFPRSKSWVRLTWMIDDPNGFVAGLGADLNLNLEGEPTLVDFGAGSFVYAPLRKGQAAMLRGGSVSPGKETEVPAWQVLTGPIGALSPYVVAPHGAQTPKAEGWAHIMDRTRCLAVAMSGFPDPGQESEITIDAEGRLRMWKHFAQGGSPPLSGPKKLTFWLHFVGMPVHVGAATSPQAMLAPLRVEVKPQGERKDGAKEERDE